MTLTYPISASDRAVYIDGISIDEIALLSGDAERLEYEDVRLGFDKMPDEFTYNMYKDLLAVIYRGRADDISLWDDVESKYFGNSDRIGIGDLSPEFANELDAVFNTPTDVAGFELYMNSVAARNYESANAANTDLMFEYLFEDTKDVFKQEAILSESAVDRIVAILKMDRALINDVDRDRANEILRYLESKGCDKFDDLGDLIDIFIKTPTRADIYGPRMDRLNSSMVCQYKVVLEILKQYLKISSNDDLAKIRQKKKSITYTNFDRMITLQSFLQIVAQILSETPREFNDVLIIGPGLEQMNHGLRESVPRQSFEPFAVIDGLLQNGSANIDDINVDLIDINDRVVAYFDRIVQRAIESGYLTLYCPPNTDRFGMGLAGVYVSDSEIGIQMSCERLDAATAVIHSKVVKRLKATDGNIITDYLAPDGSYDMIVIMNTFMYFTPEESAIALENISRLLSSGGILMTDVDPSNLPKNSRLISLITSDGVISRINLYKKE